MAVCLYDTLVSMSVCYLLCVELILLLVLAAIVVRNNAIECSCATYAVCTEASTNVYFFLSRVPRVLRASI